MKKEDKKGLSTVIATILIVLLVMIAVVIVWSVVKNMLKKGSEEVSLGKFTIDLEIVSIKQTPNDVSVKVRRNPGEGDLEGITFVIFDGEDSYVREVHNVSLLPLETKTFVLDYQGEIVSISIYPLFLSSSGKISTGGIADTYYSEGGGYEEGYINPGCTPNCDGKECGDDGCGGQCSPGCSGSTPYCVYGSCEEDTGGVEGDCSCAETTCVGTTCDNGLGETCYGTLQPDWINSEGEEIMCGPSDNGCGDPIECAVGECYFGTICCEEGYHSIDGETCIPDCTPNCLGKDCGEDGCGGECGYCNLPPFGEGYICNEITQLCEECTPNCDGRECGPVPNGCGENCGECIEPEECNMLTFTCGMCTPLCTGGRDCGISENNCGYCGDDPDGECPYPETCEDGFCTPPEVYQNQGTIYSVWPLGVGKIFDSYDLNKTIPSGYFDFYWVKFPGSAETDCLQIEKFVTPNSDPELQLIYNLSYIKLSTYSSDIEAGDNYEIWETYDGCTSS